MSVVCQTQGCGHGAGHHKNYVGSCGMGRGMCPCLEFTAPEKTREEVIAVSERLSLVAWNSYNESVGNRYYGDLDREIMQAYRAGYIAAALAAEGF